MYLTCLFDLSYLCSVVPMFYLLSLCCSMWLMTFSPPKPIDPRTREKGEYRSQQEFNTAVRKYDKAMAGWKKAFPDQDVKKRKH